ncbi:MAG: S8 family serine peptidase, partial [Actinomycetes bacterium]
MTSGKSWWLRDINWNSGMDIASIWSSLEATTFPARASGSAIKVAVIDTGFYLTHPDKGTNIVTGKDEFATYDGVTDVLTKDLDVTPVDPSAPLNAVTTASHGTCVAGQISAGTNNGVGVAGITYDSTVLVYKVQGVWIDGDPVNGFPAGSAVIFDSAIIDAIDDATAAGAKVINMSLAGEKYSQSLQDAIDRAWSSGVLVVAATGNTGTSNGVQYPGANAHVVGVGSYTPAGTAGGVPTGKVRSDFTDYGVGRDAAGAGANNGRLDILAPGQGVWGLIQPGYDYDGSGTVYEPGYYWWQGTSMASPAFAGMAAMVWRFAPALTPDQIADLFCTTASPGSWSSDLGYGYVNPTAAYARLKSDYPYLLAPASLTMPASSETSAVALSWSAVAGTAVSYDVSDNGAFLKNVTGLSTTVVLSGGSHLISVTPRSDYNWWDPNVKKSGTVVVMLPPGTLSGTVTSGGSPLAGVAVSVPGTATVTTLADGTYSVAGISPGTYSATYSKSKYATQTVSVVISSATTTTQNVALVPLPGALAGIVTSGGSPLAGASVSVPGTSTVVTAANGTYSVAGISPGTYT